MSDANKRRLQALLHKLEQDLEDIKCDIVSSFVVALGQIDRGAVPEMPVRLFASHAASLELALNNELMGMRNNATDAVSMDLIDKTKHEASLMVQTASKAALKTLAQIYDPAIEAFSDPYISVLRHKLKELINDMKCRKLDEVCHEREITDTYEDFCEGRGESPDAYRRAALMRLPRNITLCEDLVKETKRDFEREIKIPREIARQKRAEQYSEQKNWVPNGPDVEKSIERGVALVKNRVRYTLENAARRAWKEGYACSSLTNELNEYFFCVQERVLANTGVWGTRHEDRVAILFEDACTQCNKDAMTMYEDLVDKRIEEVKKELMDIVMKSFGLYLDSNVPPRVLDEEDRVTLEKLLMTTGRRLMGHWTVSTDKESGQLIGPVLHQVATLQAEASAIGWSRASDWSKIDRPNSSKEAVRNNKEAIMAVDATRRAVRSQENTPAATPAMEMESSGKDSTTEETDISPSKRRRNNATSVRDVMFMSDRKRKALDKNTVDSAPVRVTSESSAFGRSTRKRKVLDENAVESASAGDIGESSLERSKRESREALSRRAAEYVANKEAREKSKATDYPRRKRGK